MSYNNSSRFEQILKNSWVAILVINKNRKMIEVSESLCHMWGYHYDELINQSAELLHVSLESYRNFGKIAVQIVLEKQALSINYQFKKKDGSLFWVRISGDPIGNQNETLWTMTDISQLVDAEKKVSQSEQRLSQAQEVAHIGSWEWDIQANELHWSDELWRILGYELGLFSPEYKHYLHCIHPDDKNKFLALTQRVMKEKSPYSERYRILRPDGQIRYVIEKVEVKVNETGHPIKLLGIIQDITKEQLADKKLQEQHDFIQNVIDGVNDDVIVIESDYRISLMNKKARLSFKNNQYAQNDLIKCYQLLHHQDVPCDNVKYPCPLKQVFSSGKMESVIHKHYNSDMDTAKYVEITATPLFDHNDKVYAIVESSHDITLHLEAQNKLQQQAEKLDYQIDIIRKS